MLASVPLLGLLPATAILNAAGDSSLQAVAAGELRPVYRARAAARRARGGLDGRARGRLRARGRALGERRRRRGHARRPRGVGARRAGRRSAGGGRRRRRRAAGRGGRRVRRRRRDRGERGPLRRHPVAGPRDARRAPAAAGWLSTPASWPTPGTCPRADRRRVDRRRADLPGRERRLRQGALHLRPGDRLLPGDQARAHRGPAPAGERPRPAVLRGLGARRQAGGVRAGGQCRPQCRRRRRWTSPHGR